MKLSILIYSGRQNPEISIDESEKEAILKLVQKSKKTPTTDIPGKLGYGVFSLVDMDNGYALTASNLGKIRECYFGKENTYSDTTFEDDIELEKYLLNLFKSKPSEIKDFVDEIIKH